MNAPMVRLTSLAHGGGCGCKLAPSVLQELLADQPLPAPYRQLLVGTETPDDAAVWQLDDGTCVIATTDFFMPVVDDPYDFGRIAATDAISDVYAMGAKPIMALAILGIPIDKIPPETVREILKGGAAVCASAGISGRRWPLHRFARADLRACCDRHLQDRRRAPQIRCQVGRRYYTHQTTRRRRLLGRP
jgi:selenide,water dikinase